MKKVIFSVLVLLIIVSCAPQPPPQVVIVEQPAAPQQQQQQQTVIIEEDDDPEVIVIEPEPEVVVVPSSWCGGLRHSYFTSGEIVKVSYTPDDPNVLRAGPFKTTEYVGKIPPGTRVELLDGPYCDPKGYIYWHVAIIDKCKIENATKGLAYYDSVYTAETDSTGAPWLTR